VLAGVLAAFSCASRGAGDGRDLAAGWRSLLAIRGSELGESVEIPRAPYSDAVFVGRVASRKLEEISGLTASRRRDDLLWAINDGSRKPRLHALAIDGSDHGYVQIEDLEAVDWEALASFEWQERPYLVVADVGDNFSWRNSVELVVVEEPLLDADRFAAGAAVPVAWRIRFRFEDGPRDCEAVAVDPQTLRVLLVSKRTVPAVLYELDLLPEASGPEAAPDAAPGELRVAKRLGELPGIPPPTRSDVEERRWLGRYMAMPTGFDISRDGRRAAVLTYRDGYFFARGAHESWQEALGRVPQRLALPPLRQAESIAFAADGRSLFATSEGVPAPLFRVDEVGESTRSPDERSRSPR
jgi:hypothetical protein